MNLLRIYIQESALGFEVSWRIGAAGLFLFLLWLFWHLYWKEQPLQQVEMTVSLGQIGSVKICPTWEDVQIAHRIWTELVTRKAAIPIDLEHDVIAEVYDSWYALFQRVRQLIADIPARSIRKCESTQLLVAVATETLNRGLRPHLTRWQANYRNWWEQNKERLRETTPQQLQKEYPHYSELVSDIQLVNLQLVEYANELRKLVRGIRKKPRWKST